MKKIVAWPVTWLFFWIGDLISWVMNRFDWAWLNPAYQRLMVWSLDVQEWAGLTSPWSIK